MSETWPYGPKLFLTNTEPIFCAQSHFSAGTLSTTSLCQGKTGVDSSSQTINFTPTPAHMSTEIATVNTFSIKGYLENTPYAFLIDTGASITAIHISVWENLRPQGRTLKSAGFQTFQTAGGTPLEVLGSFTCLFNIDGSLYPFQTYVMKNLSHNVILGRDFLFHFAKTIDFENFHLHLNPPSLPETPLYEQPSTFWNPSLVTLKAPDQLLVLPPRTETVFPVQCSFPPGTVGLITPHPQLNSKYQLLGASILCTVSEHTTVPFRVLNPHLCPVVIHPDTTLGSIDFSENMVNLETVELIDSKLSDVSQNHNTWAPERNFDLSTSALNEDQKVQLNTLLNEYSDLFANHSYDLGRTHLASHEISVENAAPVKQRPYRVHTLINPKFNNIFRICYTMISFARLSPLGQALSSLLERKMVVADL